MPDSEIIGKISAVILLGLSVKKSLLKYGNWKPFIINFTTSIII
jgi:hypothetical protein